MDIFWFNVRERKERRKKGGEGGGEGNAHTNGNEIYNQWLRMDNALDIHNVQALNSPINLWTQLFQPLAEVESCL